MTESYDAAMPCRPRCTKESEGGAYGDFVSGPGIAGNRLKSTKVAAKGAACSRGRVIRIRRRVNGHADASFTGEFLQEHRAPLLK